MVEFVVVNDDSGKEEEMSNVSYRGWVQRSTKNATGRQFPGLQTGAQGPVIVGQ